MPDLTEVQTPQESGIRYGQRYKQWPRPPHMPPDHCTARKRQSSGLERSVQRRLDGIVVHGIARVSFPID